MKRFKSIDSILSASTHDLLSTKGITKNIVTAIKNLSK